MSADEELPLKPLLDSRATVWGTGFNMFKNIMGAGLLGLPYALAHLGLAGVFVMGGSALASMAALYFIVSAIDLLRRQGDSQPFSYKALATAAFGERAGSGIDFVVLFYTGFGLAAYAVLVVDFLGPPLHLLLGPGLWDTAPGVLVWAGPLIFGLCCLPSLEALKFTSLAGNMALLYTVLLVVYEWYSSPPRSPNEALWPSWSPTSFKVAGIFTTAFNLHYNMPVFYANLQPYPLASMMRLTTVVFLFVLLIYVPTALFGYLTFGAAVQSNVLRNFGNEARFLVCRLGLGLMIVATFPIVASSTRAALGRLAGFSQPLPPRLQVASSFLIVAFACFVACIAPSFGVVLAYNGALLGTLQQLIFPAAAFLSLSKGVPGFTCQRAAAVCVAAMGVAIASLGTLAQTQALLQGAG